MRNKFRGGLSFVFALGLALLLFVPAGEVLAVDPDESATEPTATQLEAAGETGATAPDATKPEENGNGDAVKTQTIEGDGADATKTQVGENTGGDASKAQTVEGDGADATRTRAGGDSGANALKAQADKGITDWASLQAAINAGGTVTLSQDIESSE